MMQDTRAQNYYSKAIIIYILVLSGRISRETACFCHSSVRVCVISINKGKQAMTTIMCRRCHSCLKPQQMNIEPKRDCKQKRKATVLIIKRKPTTVRLFRNTFAKHHICWPLAGYTKH